MGGRDSKTEKLSLNSEKNLTRCASLPVVFELKAYSTPTHPTTTSLAVTQVTATSIRLGTNSLGEKI